MTIYGMLRGVFQKKGPATPAPEGTRDGVPAPRTKVCTRCKQEKPITDFYKNRTSKGGVDTRCKSCHNAQISVRRRKQGADDGRELTKATVPSGIVPTETKVCTICKQEKPVTDFYPNGANKYRSACKSCDAKRRQERTARYIQERSEGRIITTTKTCRRCKKEKPVSEFYPNTRARDGLDIYCTPCRCAEQRDRYHGRVVPPKSPDPSRAIPDADPAPVSLETKVLTWPQSKQVILPATAKALVQKTEIELITELKNDQVFQGKKLDELTRKLDLLLESQTKTVFKTSEGGAV